MSLQQFIQTVEFFCLFLKNQKDQRLKITFDDCILQHDLLHNFLQVEEVQI